MASPSSGKGPSSAADGGKISSIASGGMTWVDVVDPGSAEMAILARDYHFQQLDMDSYLSMMELTKMEDRGDYFLISLRTPDKIDQMTITSNQVAMFLGKDYLVTLHPSSLGQVSKMFQSCQADQSARGALMKSSAYVAYRIIDELLDDIFPILDGVQASLDAIEAVVFDEKKSLAKPINAARKQIAILRRFVYPLNLYIGDITQAQKFSKENLTIYFSDVRHKVAKISAMIEEMKDVVEIYNDTDFSISSNKTNTVLSFLTIIFTLTLPAAVVAAFYGMNIPIPGALTPGAWTSPLGPYTSLIFILIVILVPTGIMVAYFGRKGWF